MKPFLRIFGLLTISLTLSACQTMSALPVEPSAGTENTGLTTSASLLQPLGGGLVSRALGQELPRSDRALALQNEYRALEYTAPGEAVLWQGDRLNGRIVPSQPYRVGSQDCRQYEHTVNDRAAQTTVRGTACRNEDGSWELLS